MLAGVLALGLMFALLDPPDWPACEVVPWGADTTGDMDPWTRDEVVLGEDERPIYVRVCGLGMGFGYTQVLLAVWAERPGSIPASIRVEQGVTACSKTTLEREPDGLLVRTNTCGYHDDEPIGRMETHLRWVDGAPFVVVVD